mgnify:CR=1 FL=1
MTTKTTKTKKPAERIVRTFDGQAFFSAVDLAATVIFWL